LVDNRKIGGKIISRGSCVGKALLSKKPISFLGGVDPYTGTIIDEHSDIRGESIKDKILIFPRGKGSSVGSYVILQIKKNGVAPKGIVNEKAEVIVAIGAVIAEIPMLEMRSLEIFDFDGHTNLRFAEEEIKLIKDGEMIKLNATGHQRLSGYIEVLNDCDYFDSQT